MTIPYRPILALLAGLLAVSLVRAAARPRPRLVVVGGRSARGWTTHTSLEKTLVRWCRRARCRLVWRPRHDYKLEARARFRGPFLHALAVFARALALARVPLALRYYRGNRVLLARRWTP
jgi:hypothetical protein